MAENEQVIGGGELIIRQAQRADVSEIVRMLADDELGKEREQYTDPLPDAYYAAFQAIDNDPFNELIVAEISDGAKYTQVIGTFQLTFLPSISHRGGMRAQIEAVRVDVAYRNQGIGRMMMEWAIDRAEERGCHLIQLTTNAERADAHRFYKRLGFTGSHIGMKRSL